MVFFFPPQGEEEGKEGNQRLSHRAERWHLRKGRSREGRGCAASGGAVWGQALNIILLEHLSGKTSQREQRKEPLGPEVGREVDSSRVRVLEGRLRGREVLPGGGGMQPQCLPLLSFTRHPSSDPGLTPSPPDRSCGPGHGIVLLCPL